jgi:hypothetical protein
MNTPASRWLQRHLRRVCGRDASGMRYSTGCFLEQPTRARHREAGVDVVDKRGVLGYGGLFMREGGVRYTPLMYVTTMSSNAPQIICL